MEKAQAMRMLARSIVGTGDTVRIGIDALITDELIIVPTFMTISRAFVRSSSSLKSLKRVEGRKLCLCRKLVGERGEVDS
jgi:hypothetical protein